MGLGFLFFLSPYVKSINRSVSEWKIEMKKVIIANNSFWFL